MPFAVARNINGISLNGFEYLMKEDNTTILTFPTTDAAKKFMFNVAGATEEDFTEGCYNIVDLSTNEVVG